MSDINQRVAEKVGDEPNVTYRVMDGEPVEASRWFLGQVKGRTLGDVMAGE